MSLHLGPSTITILFRLVALEHLGWSPDLIVIMAKICSLIFNFTYMFTLNNVLSPGQVPVCPLASAKFAKRTEKTCIQSRRTVVLL